MLDQIHFFDTGPMRVRRSMLGVGAIVVLLFAFTFASRAEAAPRIGLMFDGASSGSLEPYERSEEWAIIQKSGTTLFRMPIDEGVVTARGWAGYEKAINGAAEHGITILPILTNGTRFPASEYGPWETWVRSVVGKFGTGGSFWTGKSYARPITAWEVWNEPNLPENNPIPGGKNGVYPELYAHFLVATSGAIRAVNSSAQVLFGGLYMPDTNVGPFLETAATVVAERTAYSGVSIHPYAPSGSVSQMKTEVNEMRGELNVHVAGAAGKSIWITEFGWPVRYAEPELPAFPGFQTQTEAGQAALVNESIAWAKEAASTDLIESVLYYNDRDSNVAKGWQYGCGLRDEVGNFRRSWFTFQAQAGAPRWPVTVTAFQANTGNLMLDSRSGGPGGNVYGMAAGTSPSIGQYNGGWEAAFQANTGTLWFQTVSSVTNTGLPMAAGTSPSITALQGGDVAYHGTNGDLWIYEPGSGAKDTGVAMAPGTNPAITYQPRLYYTAAPPLAAAVQGAGGTMEIYEGGSVVNTGLGMAAHTSPAMAALDSTRGDSRFVIAFQVNSGYMWLYEPNGINASTGYGMAAGTNAAVASEPGGSFAASFQANSGAMWLYVPNGIVASTGIGMQAGASPAITGLSDGPPYYGAFEIALSASTNTIWTYEPSGYVTNTIYGNAVGTSASISPG
jgi:hypothetical protein